MCPYANQGVSHHLRAIDAFKRGKKMPDRSVLKEEISREFVAAAAELGVTDARFLGHDDEIITVGRSIVEEIADVIGEVQPIS